MTAMTTTRARSRRLDVTTEPIMTRDLQAADGGEPTLSRGERAEQRTEATHSTPMPKPAGRPLSASGEEQGRPSQGPTPRASFVAIVGDGGEVRGRIGPTG